MSHTPGAQRARGFSLIELLVVIGITTLMMVVLFQMLLAYSKTLATQQATVEIGVGVESIASEVQSFVTQATTIVASRAFSGTTHTTSATTLVVELPAIDSTGSIITGAHDYVVFYANGTTAYRTLSTDGTSARASGTKTLSKQVEAMQFIYNNGTPTAATTVTVHATTSATTRQGTVTTHRSVLIPLRNSSL
jgi:prepilin-type N-terminal cleavage/methylation domain-containing protein